MDQVELKAMEAAELKAMAEKLAEVKKDFDFVSHRIGEKEPHDYRLHVCFIYKTNKLFIVFYRNYTKATK
jgi:hypothetical protein